MDKLNIVRSQLINDTRGASATEYAVVLAGIALAVAAGATKFSDGANKGLEGLGKQVEKLGG